jgi:hypothetical protein
LIGVSIAGLSAFCAAELNAAIGVRGSLRVAAGLAMLGSLYALWRLTRIERLSPIDREELDAVKNVAALGLYRLLLRTSLPLLSFRRSPRQAMSLSDKGIARTTCFSFAQASSRLLSMAKKVRTMRQGDHFGEIACC